MKLECLPWIMLEADTRLCSKSFTVAVFEVLETGVWYNLIREMSVDSRSVTDMDRYVWYCNPSLDGVVSV